MKTEENEARIKLKEAISRFEQRLSRGNLNLREYQLYFNYIRYLLSDLKTMNSEQTDMTYWRRVVGK